MNWQWLCLVALGGAAGSVCRGSLSLLWSSRFPWGTLIVNVLGSLLIGWLMAKIVSTDPATTSRWQAFLVTGFCGGFTTFSSFSWQTLERAMAGEFVAAGLNVVLSVFLCLIAVWIGFRLGH